MFIPACHSTNTSTERYFERSGRRKIHLLFCLNRYPDSWYRDITSNKRFFSLAATYKGGIVGMIVSEIKGRTKVHKEVCLRNAFYTLSQPTNSSISSESRFERSLKECKEIGIFDLNVLL